MIISSPFHHSALSAFEVNHISVSTPYQARLEHRVDLFVPALFPQWKPFRYDNFASSHFKADTNSTRTEF